MKHKVNELIEKYSRETVKYLSAVCPKASAAICNSDLSVMPAHDANEPTPYVPNITSLLQKNYEVIPNPVTISFRRCANYPFCTSSAYECNGFRPALCKNHISKQFELPKNDSLDAIRHERRKMRKEKALER